MSEKANATVFFEKDVKPLFRPNDIKCMKRHGVQLDDYDYMSDAGDNHAHAQNVYDQLTSQSMPPGGPFWSDDQLKLFANWMKGGFQK